MRRLKRFVISAAMAGTAVGVAAPAAVVSSVNVMAQESVYHAAISWTEGGRVESDLSNATVYNESNEIFGSVSSGRQLKIKAVPNEGYEFLNWDFQGTVVDTNGSRYSSETTIDIANATGELIKAKAVFVKKVSGEHTIENSTRYGSMPEKAKAGDMVHIETRTPDWFSEVEENKNVLYYGYSEYYGILRADNGVDVSDQLLESKYEKDFIMPDYDIIIVTSDVISNVSWKAGDGKVEDEIEWGEDLPVFSIKDEGGILNGITEARAGETVRLQAPVDVDDYYYEIYRKDNGEDIEDITEQIEWIDKDSFFMPECDIIVEVGYLSGALKDTESPEEEDGSVTEEKKYTIFNESGADVVESALPGEEIFLKTPPLPEEFKKYIEEGAQNVSYNEDYSIIRIEDKKDVTDELLNTKTDSFVMPAYDVQIITKTITSSIAPLPKDMDNVKSQITEADGTVVDEEKWIENKNATPEEDKDLSLDTEEEGTPVARVAKTVQSAGEASATKAVVSRIASSAPATVTAAGTTAVTPVTTRRSGTNPTIVNTAPATGDSTGSIVWIIAVAGATVAAGAAAVTMIQRRKNEG